MKRNRTKCKLTVRPLDENPTCKITKQDAFCWCLDRTLALIIRDSLIAFTQSDDLGIPSELWRTRREETDEKITDEEIWREWRAHILRVAGRFDEYATYGADAEDFTPDTVKEMFAELAEIFPHLWT